MSDRRKTDIAIIGGGMVGASLAALLPHSLNAIVLESFPMPPASSDEPVYQPSYDARSTALSQSSCDIFKKAELWALLSKHVQVISNVHVSDKGSWGSTLMSAEDEAMEALGYVVENAWLGRSLLYALQQRSNIEFCCPAKVTRLIPEAEGVKLLVEQNDQTIEINASLAIVADGAQSQICRSLGIHIDVLDYGSSAIVSNVSTARAHNGLAYERFTENGPLALLPLLDSDEDRNRSALIWTMPNEQAEALMQEDDASFLRQLQEVFGYRQGEMLKVGKRFSYPLKLSSATEQVRNNIVVLGNAAHSLHPVAGQGFNLALRDVDVLCRLLAESVVEQKPVGDIDQLQKYVQSQQQDQWLTTSFSDLLPDLFARNNIALKLGRGVGLLGLELTPELKSSFIRFATGVRRRA